MGLGTSGIVLIINLLSIRTIIIIEQNTISKLRRVRDKKNYYLTILNFETDV
jgi:hypothetical protein